MRESESKIKITETEYYVNIASVEAFVDFIDTDGTEKHATVSDAGEFGRVYVVADRRIMNGTDFNALVKYEHLEEPDEDTIKASPYAEVYAVAEKVMEEGNEEQGL